jgi:hypothetical protein
MWETGLSSDDEAKHVTDRLGCDVWHDEKLDADTKMQNKESDKIWQWSSKRRNERMEV